MGALLSFGVSLLGQWQRILIYGALVLSFVVLIWGHGYHKGSQRLFEYQTDQARAAVVIVTKQGAVTEKIVNRYIKVKGDTQIVTVTVEKEVERYAETNPGRCLDGAWRRLHDAAALNAVPPAPGLSDGERGAPTAAQALTTVTENYAGCHRTADRLNSLQEWVREQGRITAP